MSTEANRIIEAKNIRKKYEDKMGVLAYTFVMGILSDLDNNFSSEDNNFAKFIIMKLRGDLTFYINIDMFIEEYKN